jgi:hypothetical protein
MSKKNSKRELKLRTIPKLTLKDNFPELSLYTKFFEEMEPIIKHYMKLSLEELEDKNKELIDKYAKYYIVVFNDYVSNYTSKIAKSIKETYSKVCMYAINLKLPETKYILNKYVDTSVSKLNKLEVSKKTKKILKPCPPGYIRNPISNKCMKNDTKLTHLYFGPLETPKGMTKATKHDAIKYNKVSYYGKEKITSSDLEKIKKLNSKDE